MMDDKNAHCYEENCSRLKKKERREAKEMKFIFQMQLCVPSVHIYPPQNPYLFYFITNHLCEKKKKSLPKAVHFNTIFFFKHINQVISSVYTIAIILFQITHTWWNE